MRKEDFPILPIPEDTFESPSVQDPNSTNSLRLEISRIFYQSGIEQTGAFSLEQRNREDERLPEKRKRALVALAQAGHLSEDPEAVELSQLAVSRILLSDMDAIAGIANKLRTSIPIDDLMQEGCRAYEEGIYKYDPTLGFNVITYCLKPVRWMMMRYINDKNSIIRIPRRSGINKGRILALRFNAGQTPLTIEQIAQQLNMPTAKVAQLMELPTTFSIDAITEGKTIGLLDTIPSSVPEDMPEELVLEAIARDELFGFVDQITEARKRTIIRLNYGIGGDEMSLKEIGTILGRSRERIRQLRDEALDELKMLLLANS